MPERTGADEGSGFGGGRGLGAAAGRLLDQAQTYAHDNAATSLRVADAAVSFRGVTTYIESSLALNELDLDIPAGSLTAIVGALGPAKQAFIEHIIGSRVPDAGEVTVLGTPIQHLSEEDLLARSTKVGVVLRGGGLMSSMTVYDNVGLLLRTEGPPLQNAELDATISAQLDELGLSSIARRLPGDIGRGQRIRAALARALVMGPGLILLDEPEAGLTPPMARMMGELISYLHYLHKGTWVLMTSDLTMVRLIARYVVLLRRGRGVAAGTFAELAAAPNPFVRAVLGVEAGAPQGAPTQPPGQGI